MCVCVCVCVSNHWLKRLETSRVRLSFKWPQNLEMSCGQKLKKWQVLLSTKYSIFKCLLVVQNAELFALTYGSLVMQLIRDHEDYAEVNKQLEKL